MRALRIVLGVVLLAFVAVGSLGLTIGALPIEVRRELVAPATVGCAGATPPTPAQLQTDETIALNLTGAACSVADTTGVSQVIFGCALATVLENGAISVTQLFDPVPASAAAAFAAKHPETEASKPLVLAYKTLHPAAAVGPLPR